MPRKSPAKRGTSPSSSVVEKRSKTKVLSDEEDVSAEESDVDQEYLSDDDPDPDIGPKFKIGMLIFYSKDYGEVKRFIIYDIDKNSEDHVYHARDTKDRNSTISFSRNKRKGIYINYHNAISYAKKWKSDFKKDMLKFEVGQTVYYYSFQKLMIFEVKKIEALKKNDTRIYT